MKATTFEPQTDSATALVAPDALVLTVGALVNRALDRASGPRLLIIDQLSDPPTIRTYTALPTDAQVVASTSWTNLGVQFGDVLDVEFQPGAGPTGDPFEG